MNVVAAIGMFVAGLLALMLAWQNGKASPDPGSWFFPAIIGLMCLYLAIGALL